MAPMLAARRILLIDTNLLLVLAVGFVDRDHIERFKRTCMYTREDFDLLVDYVSQFDGLVITPNVLTEVSNLAGSLSEPLRSRVFAQIAVIAHQMDERYVPSTDATHESDFLRLGLTDSSIVLAASGVASVLTDDLGLYLKLSASGVQVVNFNHVRTGAVE